MSGWLVATLAAALLQTIRTALQQRLKGRLSTNAAGFVRYAFGAPFSLGAVAVMAIFGIDLPTVSAGFLFRVTVAGAAQIIGTFFLITAFTKRDFAIGTVYSKTEAIQVALISGVLLSEGLKPLAWVGMITLMVGIIILATKGSRSALSDLFSKKGNAGMWAGIAAGTGFAIAATFIRGASNTLGPDVSPVVRALFTLAIMNSLQVVMNGGWLAVRTPSEFGAIRKQWRSSALVGLLSVTGSAGWAIGVTLQKAAIVRAVGQIDIVFAFIVGTIVFHEQRRRSEFVGTLVVALGVVVVTLAR